VLFMYSILGQQSKVKKQKVIITLNKLVSKQI